MRTVYGKSALFQVEQAAGAAKVVQQMPIDVQQVGIVTKVGYHVGIPNLGQLRARMHESASPSMPAASRNDQALARSPLTNGAAPPSAISPTPVIFQSPRALVRQDKFLLGSARSAAPAFA
jgi:hypothetical protein